MATTSVFHPLSFCLFQVAHEQVHKLWSISYLASFMCQIHLFHPCHFWINHSYFFISAKFFIICMKYMFVFSFVYWRLSWLFSVFRNHEKKYESFHIQVLCAQVFFFNYLGKYLGAQPRLYDKAVFSIVRNCQTFLKGYIPFWILLAMKKIFKLLCIFASIWNGQFFGF